MVWLGLALPAAAQGLSDGQAKEAYQRGAQAYAKHQYSAAASAFEEGFRLKPHPAFLFNLALTHRAMGQPQQAISYYERYLEALPSAPDRAQVEAAIADERRKLPAAAIATRKTAPAEAASASSSAAVGGLTSTGRDAGSTERTPIYRKWWFWAAGGAVVIAAVGIGLGVGLQPGTVAPYREVTWQ
jgi:tetratricopeptide (TPR) repeat protein